MGNCFGNGEAGGPNGYKYRGDRHGRQEKSRKKKKKTGRGKAGGAEQGGDGSISTVVTMLLAVLLIQGQSLQKRIQENEQRKEELLAETETEQERTSEIEDMEEYMQSDEYIEKIAREKIGLVKDNEIIFKEVK